MTRSNDPITEPVNPEEWGETQDIFGTPYNADLSPLDTSAGKVLKSEAADGTEFAGKTIRQEFERAARAPTQSIWIGHEYSAKNLRSRIGGIDSDTWFQPSFFSGSTGTGKSTVLTNTLVQKAYAGWGFCFVDPHGDTIRNVLARIPEYRLDDVVYIAPPVGEFEKTATFNLLEVPEFDDEAEEKYDARVSNVVEQNIGVIGANQEMYARMEGILKAVMQAMIEADEPYTMMSIQRFLKDESLQHDFTPYIDDAAVQDYNENIANIDQEDIDPLTRRMNDWILNKVARRVISHSESSVNISECVENGKIVLVDTKSGEVGKKVSKAVASAVVQRVWATVKARSGEGSDPETRRPFFLCIDELNDALTPHAPIPAMLENARKYRLALLLATQYPAQLEEENLDWMDPVLGQASTFVTLKVTDDDSASALANKFDGIEPDDIEQLPDYNAFMNVQSEDGTPEPVRVQTFPKTPPLRSKEAVRRVIEQSLDKHGTDPNSGVKYEATTIDQVVNGDGVIDTGTGEIETGTLLQAVDAVELFAGATVEGEFVSLKRVGREIQARVDQDLSTRQLEKAVVQLPETFIDVVSGDARGTYVSLTVQGQEKARDALTGDGGAAGGAEHQVMVQEARNLFTKLRCDASAPDPSAFQGSPPDGIAELPVSRDPTVTELQRVADGPLDLVDKSPQEYTAADIRRVNELEATYVDELPGILAEYHDALPVVSGARDMYFEVEKSTATKPALTFRNLAKAVNDEKRCVFVTKDSAVKDKIVRNICTEPLFCREMRGEHRVLYTGEAKFDVGDEKDEWVALRDGDAARTKWRDTVSTDREDVEDVSGEEWGVDDDREFVLETTSGEELLRVTAGAVESGELREGAAQAWGGWDSDRQAHVAHTVGDDGRVSTRVYDSKDAFQDDWSKVTRPFVPELMFDAEPRREDWCAVVLPGPGEEDVADPTVFTVDSTGEQSEHVIQFDGWGRGENTDDAPATNDTVNNNGDDVDGETSSLSDIDAGSESAVERNAEPGVEIGGEGRSGDDEDDGGEVPVTPDDDSDDDGQERRGESVSEDGSVAMEIVDDTSSGGDGDGEVEPFTDYNFDGVRSELRDDENESSDGGEAADSWGGSDDTENKNESGERDSGSATSNDANGGGAGDESDSGDEEDADEFDFSNVEIEGAMDERVQDETEDSDTDTSNDEAANNDDSTGDTRETGGDDSGSASSSDENGGSDVDGRDSNDEESADDEDDDDEWLF